MDKKLAKAIAQYKRATRVALETTDAADEGPFLVAENISKIAYETWVSTQEQRWPLLWKRQTKEVWLYGDSSRLHGMAATYFSFMLGAGLGRDSKHMATERSPLEIPAGIKEPDFAFWPRDADQPTVVGEVAYHIESFEALLQEQVMWQAAAYVQFFIGLKITDRTQAQQQDPRLTAITWRRATNESTCVEFGLDPSCTRKNDSRRCFWRFLLVVFFINRLCSTRYEQVGSPNSTCTTLGKDA